MDYLKSEEVSKLIKLAKSGDNDAWEKLYINFERYIHECSWKRLRSFKTTADYYKKMEEDLYMAGWQGFVSAVKNYNPEKGEFLTYATHYINGDISKELNFLLNPLGLTERPKSEKEVRISLEEHPDVANSFHKAGNEFSVQEAPDRGKYSAERRVLQILEVLRMLTDEEHSLSKDELGKMLSLYRIAKHKNGTQLEYPHTITSTLENMLEELDPLEYSDDNDADYKVKYEGYKQDRLKQKLNKDGGRKSLDITGFSYVHIFNNDELDKLIQLVSFTDMLSLEEKSQLIIKLTKTASIYYKSPFWDGEQLKFNPSAIHSRFDTRKNKDMSILSGNLKIIKQAVNNMAQVRFRFNRYTAEKIKVPTSEYEHILSPYHLVVYHDNYYCIGLKKDDKRIWHYRVDLMSDIEIIRDGEGKIVPVQVVNFEGLPISNASWNPEKYMSEHLYMAYDEPRDIYIKIKNTDYTIIHDWFLDNYERTELTCEAGYDIVKVKTSPSMIVHWAMQYVGRVEIMDEDVMGKIWEEIEELDRKYRK